MIHLLYHEVNAELLMVLACLEIGGKHSLSYKRFTNLAQGKSECQFRIFIKSRSQEIGEV